MAAIAARRVLHAHRFSPRVWHGGLSHSYSARTAGAGNGTRHTKPAPSDDIPTSSIRRPLLEVLRELGKKVPESYVKVRKEEGMDVKYIPWHIVNRIMNVHAPEWSGEVRSVVYAPDGKSVTVVYRATLRGTDAEIYRESSGTASMNDTSYGDPVQKAEAMAFRRACARLGLGLHLYHEDLL